MGHTKEYITKEASLSQTVIKKIKQTRQSLLKRKKYKIFIVEDNSLVQKILQHTFESKQHIEVYSFYSGEECLKNIELAPDIAILDYNLSPNPNKLNGLEILDKMNLYSPQTKFIMLSSQEQVSIAVECLKKGATDYVVKDPGMRVKIKKAVSNIIKNIELKNEILYLSRKIKRDKLLMKGYFIIFLAMLILGIFLFR